MFLRSYAKQHIKAVRRCYDRFRVLPLDQLRGLPVLKSFDTTHCAVYFLWFGPELVYVGKAVNVGHRIYQHRMARKEFTHATYERGHHDCVRDLEADYVRRYTPLLNLTSSG
jgi:hypothetical protein